MNKSHTTPDRARKNRNALSAIVTLAFIVATTCTAGEIRPYTHSKVLDEPVIFGEGFVSTELPEFATTFSPDGTEVFFNRMPADRSRIEMLVSRFVDGSWTEAEALPFSGTYRDVDPFVSGDGSRLYFSSDRPDDDGQEAGDWNTWYVERDGSGWGEPVRLGSEVNSEAAEIFVSLTDSGTLVFRRSNDDARDIYTAERKGEGFASPQPIPGLGLEDPGNPLIARDGSFLIVASSVEGRSGDLFISFRQGNQWTPARNLGESVNSVYADFAPGLSPDGKYLFFTSERPGLVAETVEGRRPGDIYQVELRALRGITWPD